MTTPYGTALRQARKAARRTLADLADFLGVTISYVSDIERGNRSPLDDDRTSRVARYLQADPNVLFDAAARTRGQFHLPLEGGCSDEHFALGAEFARKWRSRNEADTRRLREILKQL